MTPPFPPQPVNESGYQHPNQYLRGPYPGQQPVDESGYHHPNQPQAPKPAPPSPSPYGPQYPGQQNNFGYAGSQQSRYGYTPPPKIAPHQTQAVVNNQMALGAQQAAQKSYAGTGLSYGKGQMALDANRGGVARANAENQSATTQMQDQQANSGALSQYLLGKSNEGLQYDSLAEQARQSQWDSRFGNLTSAWGLLAGLLR